MRSGSTGLHVGIAAMWLLLLAAPVGAQTITIEGGGEVDEAEFQRMLDECYDGRMLGDGLPDCVFDEQGQLVQRVDASPANPIAGFLVFAVVWTLIPLGIAGAVASSRGESVPLAVVLTLVLGWIGLAIVVFGQRRAVAEVRRVADPSGPRDATRTRLASPVEEATQTKPLTRVEAAAAASAADSATAVSAEDAGTQREEPSHLASTTGERLRVLDELCAAGVITESERAERRKTILDEV